MITTDPLTDEGTIVIGRPCRIVATLPSPLAVGVTPTLTLGDGLLALPLTVDPSRQVLSRDLTVAEVATVAVKSFVGFQITAGVDDELVPFVVGRLARKDKWTGTSLPGVATAGASEAALAHVSSLAAQAAQVAAQAAQAVAVPAAAAAVLAQAAAEAARAAALAETTAALAAQNASLSSTYGAKGGATKTDGQNLRNLRRPTLVIDKAFPNGRHDHQIVWVDEAAKVAYAIGQDNGLRKSTWTQAGDEAQIFSSAKSAATGTNRWGAFAVFHREPTSGALLMEQGDSSGATTELLRSADDGVNWTTVWAAPGSGKRLLGPQSIAQDYITNYLYLVEYTINVAATTVDIWRSTDLGVTWAVWKSVPRSELLTAGVLRHWHSTRWDAVSQRVYFTAGDQQADGGIYRVNAAGTDIEPVILNKQISTQFDVVSAARCVDVMFFPTHIVWASDGSGGIQNHIYRMARTQIGQASPVAERVTAIDNTGWWAVNVSTDGSAWLFSTSTETPNPASSDVGTAHLYAVTNNGADVDDIAAVVMDGAALGIASVSGLGAGAGSGPAFWLRAHAYQQFPNQTFSAFQYRARIAYGVVPLVKPAQLQREYLRQGRNCGPVTLTAGQSVGFARTRVPSRTRFLSLLDFGAMAMDPVYGACKVEIWNLTAGAKLFEYAGQSWRYDGNGDVDERWAGFACPPGNEIEFRVTNTHASATIAASAFVEFGWSFQ